MDAIAAESHFLDHLAPVWLALPASVRGTFLVDSDLMRRAEAAGIEATPIDARAIRETPQRPPVHDGIPTLIASIGDIKIGRRLGHGPYAFLEHGAGQAYQNLVHPKVAASYAGGPDREDNDLFMCPNEYSASRWRSAYPGARVEVVGSPRLDGLPQRIPGPGPVVAISFHGRWPSGPYGGNALPDFVGELAGLARRFTVIGHAHPKPGWSDELQRDYWRAGIPFVADFADVCRQADVYVCDNSSTIPEFASTGRPVVLMNARNWHRKGGPGGRFWDWAHIGINVDVPAMLGDAIERALVDGPDEQRAREHALGIVYAYRTGAAERAAAAVVAWLGAREAVAA